jgi:peptidoglycan/xylan/chitin deacetylase (PgdA/CDA1 family)
MLPGVKYLERSARWLRSRVSGGALILGYHRIAHGDWDPFGLSVSPEHFAEHLAILRAHARPLPLAHLLRALHDGRVPRDGVAVTFDDGYADNLALAQPLLDMHGVPATVFVATAHRGSEFWWDALARLLSPGHRLPDRIRLTIDAECLTWSSPPPDDVRGRRRLLLAIHRRLQPLPHAAIRSIVEALGTDISGPCPASSVHRALTAEEVVELTRGGLVDIGAHGDTHSLIARLPTARQESEIRQSKALLERLLRRPILGFSYPYGSVSAPTMALVERAGFDFACASQSDVTSLRSDRFLLPRFWIPNWDGRAFLRWLRRWLRT